MSNPENKTEVGPTNEVAVEQSSGPGRPPHKPTKIIREKVRLRKAAGWIDARIAEDIGISVPILVRDYREELDSGWSKKRGEVLDMIFKSAKKGNVSAQKKLVDIIDTATPIDDPKADQPSNVPAVQQPKKAGYVSKKSEAEAAAKIAGVGTEWGEDLQISPMQRPN